MQKTFKYYGLLLVVCSFYIHAEPTLSMQDAPWQEGEVVARGEGRMGYESYRKFIKKTAKGYIVQDFYDNHQQATNQFLLVKEEDVQRFSKYYPDDGKEGLFIQGPYERWYIDGIKERRGQYNEQGKRTGLWTMWHFSGQKKAEGYYQHGKLQGVWRHWSEVRDQVQEMYFDNNQLVMVSAIDKNAEEKAPPKAMWFEWGEHRNLASQGALKDGKREGRWVFKDENDRLQAVGHYKEGKKNGIWTTYWAPLGKNEHKKTQGEYQDGKRIGIWKAWDEADNQTEEFYADDIKSNLN